MTAEQPVPNSGAGWYEVIYWGQTWIAYVYEDGSIYFPEGEQVLDRQGFAFAAARGEAHRLVRADDTEERSERCLRARIEQMVANQQSWIDAGRSGQAISRNAMRDALQLALDETAAHDAEVRALPDRETIMDALNKKGAYCGWCDFEPGWRSCSTCREMLGGYADAVLALFGQEGL